MTGLVRSPGEADLVQARERSEPRRLVHPRPGRDRAGQGPRPRRALPHRRRRHPQSGRLAEGRPDPAHDDEQSSHYALTWFGLALALAAVFAMLVWRHFRPGPPELVPSPPGRRKVRARSPPRPSVLHVSTRGEAPALGFTDALLAGLARDGGLYVPESWPALTRDDDPRLSPASPMPRSRKPCIGAARRRRDPRRRDLGRMIDGGLRLVPPSRRLRRSSSSATTSSCSSSSTARRSPSRTWRCSCSARLMDHVLKARGAPRHHRRRDLGRHRQRGRRGLHAGSTRSTSSSSTRMAASPTCSGGR